MAKKGSRIGKAVISSASSATGMRPGGKVNCSMGSSMMKNKGNRGSFGNLKRSTLPGLVNGD